MKVTEVGSYLPKEITVSAADALQAVSMGNREATVSPTTMDTAPFDKDRLKEAMKAADRLSEFSNRRLKFEYQEEADIFQVSVVDGEDVIRKIPPDAILRMIENIKRQAGTSLDTKA